MQHFHGKHDYFLMWAWLNAFGTCQPLKSAIKTSHSKTNASSPQIILFSLATSTQMLNLVVDVVLCVSSV